MTRTEMILKMFSYLLFNNLAWLIAREYLTEFITQFMCTFVMFSQMCNNRKLFIKQVTFINFSLMRVYTETILTAVWPFFIVEIISLTHKRRTPDNPRLSLGQSLRIQSYKFLQRGTSSQNQQYALGMNLPLAYGSTDR